MTDSALPHCPPLEQALVRFVQDLRYEDLDAPAHAGVNRLMRDQLALQIGISQMPWSQQLLKYAAAQQRPGASRVAASGLTMSAQDAAFVNGSYGHGFEYDDAHGPSYSHPGSCVIPAALALGEELGATLEEVVTALVAGYEVYTRIGLLAAPDLLQRGFHPHCVLSSFGAAAVAAKLRRLDAETTLHALAIALSHTSGTTEYTSTGGSIKRIHAGIGTKSGMAAAEMARAGITGPRAFLSGNKGFFKTFLQRGPGDGAEARFAPGQPLQIATVWLKAYCACYCTHAYIDALRPFAARRTEIADVHLKITPHFNVVVGTANANAYTPRNIAHVQFSLPIQAAFALLGLGIFAASAVGSFNVAILTDIAVDAGATGASQFLPHGYLGIWAAIPFAIWFFLAVEGVPLAAEETANPERNVPRGSIAAMTILIVTCATVLFLTTGAGGADAMSQVDDPLVQALGADTAAAKWVNYIGLAGLIARFFSIIFAYSTWRSSAPR